MTPISSLKFFFFNNQYCTKFRFDPISSTKLSSYQVDLELYKAEKEALKNAMFNSKKQALKNKSEQGSCDILTLKDQFIHLTEPKKPIWSRYKTNDATIEKLSELLADNPRGLLIYRDELIGLLSSSARIIDISG